MDTLTHALTGALIGRASAPARTPAGELGPRGRMAAGFLAAAAPDADVVLRAAGTLHYLNWHQGPTHSLLLLPLWAWLLARLFAWLFPWAGAPHLPWRAYYGVACLGIAIHIAGDFITAYGPMLLAPFSSQRFALPLSFVLDPHFSFIAGAGVAAGLLLPRRSSPAVAALALLAGYVGFQGALQQRAMDHGRVHALAQGLAGARVQALPQPLTPYNWMVVVSHDDLHRLSRVNLWRSRPPAEPGPDAGLLSRIAAGYQPLSAPHWTRHSRYGDAEQRALAREAWEHPGFGAFRRFALIPALDHIEERAEGVCVWFVDLRFTLPALPPSFRYGMCRDGPGADWRLGRIRGAFHID